MLCVFVRNHSRNKHKLSIFIIIVVVINFIIIVVVNFVFSSAE